MKSFMTAKTLTIRLPLSSYERAAQLAKARRLSLNRLFQEGLELLDQREREQRLFDDFSMIADAGTAETEVEFALAAQTQVIRES
jgi:hypothetical protein